MLLGNPLPRRRRRVGRVILALGLSLAFFLAFSLFFHPASWRATTDHLPDWDISLPLPLEYEDTPQQDEHCNALFSGAYLHRLANQSQSYCDDGASSDLTCFHTRIDPAKRDVDSLCLARGALLDSSLKKYALHCPTRALDANSNSLQVPHNRLRAYWSYTGPKAVLQKAIKLRARPHPKSSSPTFPRFQLLLKREGDTNLWHTLLEIWSASMTFDVLRLARDPHNPSRPLFRHPIDSHHTQAVILDDHADGPYFDLWRLFAQGSEPVRLKTILANPTAHSHAFQEPSNLIIPLAGGSNPLWKLDWANAHHPTCTASPTLRVFSRRVLTHYNITTPPGPNSSVLTLTLITRLHTRRLLNQPHLLTTLTTTFSTLNIPVHIQTIDFASLPFPAQLRVSQATDVLVGVHGAGLTHAMFMRPGDGAVVELQPEGIRGFGEEGEGRQVGYANLAGMMGLGYESMGVVEVEREGEAGVDGNGVEWGGKDVRVVEDGEFVRVVVAAVEGLLERRGVGKGGG